MTRFTDLQDWNKAQEARVKCAAAWAKAESMQHAAKLALLKEYLVLLFHTVMPPDVRSRAPRLAIAGSHIAACVPGSASGLCASSDGALLSNATHRARTAST